MHVIMTVRKVKKEFRTKEFTVISFRTKQIKIQPTNQKKRNKERKKYTLKDEGSSWFSV